MNDNIILYTISLICIILLLIEWILLVTKNVNFIELYFIFTFLQSYLDVFYAIRTIIP